MFSFKKVMCYFLLFGSSAKTWGGIYVVGDELLETIKNDRDKLRLPTFLASHMVLQREPQQARVWGHASPGANVTVRMNGDDEPLAFGIADEDSGKWTIDLPSQPAGFGHKLFISDGDSSITLEDVAFGDVYLCSGQSNMEMTVNASFDADAETADSIHYPNLRLATVNKTVSDHLQDDVGSKASYIWAKSSPEALNGPSNDGGRWGVYSATCYYFGRELYKALEEKVPIGLVTSCWGGQRVETFSSDDALNDKTCGGLYPSESSIERLDGNRDPLSARADADPSDDYSDIHPANKQIWNAMIYPLMPMRFSGIIWYQGEANVYAPDSYACRFPAMISDWRSKMDLDRILPFIYVELAAFTNDTRAGYYPWQRAAQAAALKLPFVGVAAAIDLADPTSPLGAIHSRRKQEVGRRVALTMRAIHYRDPDAQKEYTGPILAGVSLQTDPAHSTALLSFVSGTARNLHLYGTAACTSCCKDPPFEVLTAKGQWIRVSLATIRNQDEILLVTNLSAIYGIQYAWEGQPECALYSGNGGPDDHMGIPARPFQWCAYPSEKSHWTHEACQIPSMVEQGLDTDTLSSRELQNSPIEIPKTDDTEIISQRPGLHLHTFVDSHMVLQREPLEARIWGWAAPGASVSATLLKPHVVASVVASEKDGSWYIDFPPQPAGTGHSIEITDGISTMTLEDVAFGDVFLCSGQSNMEMTVGAVFNAEEEIADAINYPDLRIATVAQVTSDFPMDDVSSKTYYSWARSSPQAVTGNPSLVDGWDPVFSATCYFFGRDLYKSMNGTVPIGLVTSCWGGQLVEAFSSPDAMADLTCGGTIPRDNEEPSWLRRSSLDKVHIPPDSDENNFGGTIPPTQLWNAMIHPLLPMRFLAAVWYQGEGNADNAVSYACRFPAMIADWRLKFNLPNLTFLYVELAGYQPGSTYPWVRAAQGAARQLPGVGMATAIDLSDPDSPYGSIHSRRKQEVGRRLSLSMLAIQYRDPDLQYHHTGPIFNGIMLLENSVIVLDFQPGTAENLHFAGAAACEACCAELPFFVLGADGQWTRIIGSDFGTKNELYLAASISQVYGIRYAWESRPECLLYNGEGGPEDHNGLPAAPFEWCAFPSGKPSWTNAACLVKNFSTTGTQ